MNIFEDYKENGLSLDARGKISIIIGCILASGLDNKDKREHVEFMRELEKYLDEVEEDLKFWQGRRGKQTRKELEYHPGMPKKWPAPLKPGIKAQPE